MSEDKSPIPENPPEQNSPDAASIPAQESVQESPPAAECDIELDSVEMVVCPGCKAEIDTTEVPAFAKIACPACGTEMDISAKFGGFRLLRELGSGGMGAVYLGQDDALNRKVAIKVVKRSIGGNPAMLEGFQREAQATARLNHPNIVQIYAFGEEKGQPYIAMELVGGGSLDGFIEKKKRLDPAFVLRVGKEIAIALGAAQEAGLIHGDVKPENILFDENYRAKLVDFGIASALSADVNAKEIWGTPYYIAPEKAKGKKADIRSDLYSLGATLYHALTLHPPFDGADARAVVAARFAGPPAPLGKFRPDVDKKAIEIINRMLQSNPMLRFPTIASLVSSIDEYLSSVPAARAEKPYTSTTSSVRLMAVPGVTAHMTKAMTPAKMVTGVHVAAAPASDAAPEAPKKGGKKIIIAKGGKSRISMPSQTAAAAQPEVPEFDAGAMPPEEELPPGGIPEMIVETGPTPEERKKKMLKGIIVTVAVLFFLLIAGVVGVFVFLVQGEKKTGRENAARAHEARMIEQEAESYDKRVADVASRILKIDEDARRFVSDLEKIAQEATETKWKAPNLDPEDEILIDPEEAQAEPETSAEAAPAKAEAGPSVDSVLAIKDEPVFADGKNSTARKAIIKFAKDREDLAKDAELIQALLKIVRDPENIKDADMMEIAIEDALTKAKEKTAEAPAAPEAAAAEPSEALENAMDAMGGEEPAAAPEEAPAEAPEATEEVAVAPSGAQEIISKAMTLLEPARRIRRAAKEAELRRDRQSDMFSPIKGNDITAQQYNERIRFKKTREADEARLNELLAECQKDIAELRKTKTLLEREAKKFIQEIKARKLIEDKERQDQIERARKTQAEDEKKARIQRDLDEVEVLKQGATESINTFDYAAAVKHLSAYRGQYAAKEANEALQAAIDRAQRLADLKAFFLKDLHENKGLKWGLGTRDILDADPEAGTVTARGGATADIAKLTLKQWMGLIDRLIENREPDRPHLTLKQESDMLFASALFCVVHGGSSDSALRRAEDLARAAILKSEMVKLEIPRIAPELKGALEAKEGL